jgi:hypothetical protein
LSILTPSSVKESVATNFVCKSSGVSLIKVIELLLKLHCNPEISVNCSSIFSKESTDSPSGQIIAEESSANPSALSVSLFDSFEKCRL